DRGGQTDGHELARRRARVEPVVAAKRDPPLSVFWNFGSFRHGPLHSALARGCKRQALRFRQELVSLPEACRRDSHHEGMLLDHTTAGTAAAGWPDVSRHRLWQRALISRRASAWRTRSFFRLRSRFGFLHEGASQ